VLTGAERRRVFGEYQSSDPSRFIDEVPAELLIGSRRRSRQGPIRDTFHTTTSGPTRTGAAAAGENACGKRPRHMRTRTRISRPACCASRGHARPASAVRRRQRHQRRTRDNDTKLVVRFNAVGVKTLRAKYARLEPA